MESYWRDHLGRVGVEVVEGVARVAAGDGWAADAERDGSVRVYSPFVAAEGAEVASRATWLVAAADAAADATGPAEEGDLAGLDAALGKLRARYLDAVADGVVTEPVGGRGAGRTDGQQWGLLLATNGGFQRAPSRAEANGAISAGNACAASPTAGSSNPRFGTHGPTCGLAAVPKVGAQCVSSGARCDVRGAARKVGSYRDRSRSVPARGGWWGRASRPRHPHPSRTAVPLLRLPSSPPPKPSSRAPEKAWSSSAATWAT